ncbi:hypothetical protein Y1Q_0012863 [Alligator mississippiensis]|uniref:Uncharacterized protein n=1 Tax=Alligator mississippiensis TaxID=8496 RepID=A0A151P4A9_ALLMI|nr:hypothetical protein Y1Q_0012863 [Alligator mississippiensis]
MFAEGPKPTLKPKREGLLGESTSKEAGGKEGYLRMEEDEIGLELESGQLAIKHTCEDGFLNMYEGGLAKIKDEVVQPDLVQMVPRFKVRQGLLYRIDEG